MTLTEQDRFEIGGEELLPSGKSELAASGVSAQEADTESKQRAALDDIRVRIGTLLKTETVSFLLGAGASVDCGGLLIGSVPLPIEHDLRKRGVDQADPTQIREWLRVFYLAVLRAGADESPVTDDDILVRQTKIDEGQPLSANFEQVLAMLHRWHSAMPESGGRLRIDGSPSMDARAEDIEEAIGQATRALARACSLPVPGKENGHATHKTLIRKILTRPLNLKRVNVFSLNYDTLVEQAADAEGVVLLDGFIGTQRRMFRPESYEQDLYFPAGTTEGRVHRFDRVLHLYKLHGSITWTASEPTIDNPYGVEVATFSPEDTRSVLIYPTPAKYGETLGMPYAELFRRFAGALVRPQSVLFVIGYGFGDDHVNALIRQALAVPSFTLVIVDPSPKSEFVTKLREQNDRRIWISEGPTVGKLAGFVEHILPDLQEEEIRKRVLATHRALAKSSPTSEEASNGK